MPTPAHSSALPPPAVSGDPMPAAAARSMVGIALVFGAVLLLLSVAQLLWGVPGVQTVARARLVLGFVTLAGGGIGAVLARRGRFEAAVFVIIACLSAGAMFHAWASGQGLYNLVLAGVALLVAFGGALLGLRMAIGLGLLYTAAVALLAWAEWRGLVAGRRAVEAMDTGSRVIALVLLGLAAGLAAYVMHRLLKASLHDARREQHRQAQLLRIGSDWVWETDRRGRLTFISASFETHTGYSVAEALRTGEPGGPQPIEDEHWTQLGTALRSRRPFRDLPVAYVQCDGRELHLRVSGEPLHAADGKVIGWWGMSRNVTAEVMAARESQRALADAKQQAEAASQAKSAFLATMSHEIRTPLNGVLGLARLLQEERDERRRRDYLQHLMGAAEGLAGIVSDVLDLSKIEAGRVVIEDIAFDLHDLVTSTFHTFAPLGRERGLAMGCEIAPGLPRRVHGDPVRVRQILSNYLTNALKFTERGGVRVSAAAADGDNVRLAVSDSGIGIDAAARERLFLPFSQADSSTTRRFGGTGLGLSICRELAVLMRGRVGADSEHGRGSTFWVELPLAPGASPSQSATEAAEAAQALGGLTVLVAEDNPVNMLIVRTLLERLGAQVVEAEDGAQAVARATSPGAPHARIDAVLMDLHMPVQDGLSAARALRTNPATAALPLFALSAAVLEQERAQAHAAGMAEFLTKPVAEADLLRVLAPLVRR